MISLFRRYDMIGLIRLAISWILTKIFFRPARLIRIPFYIRGRESISWGQGFTTGVGVRMDAFIRGGVKAKLIIIGVEYKLMTMFILLRLSASLSAMMC